MASKKSKTLQIVSENLFPVVGVGASAGGLDAFKQLIKAIPENSGMAFIMIQHLSPKYESALSELLQQHTSLPVVQITDHIKVMADHIYILPSNKVLTANDGVLLLSPLNKNDRLNIIDVFFSSLAEIHLENAIGIVLSGTGADGTVGLKMIKDQGGITIAQDSQSAAYYGMPQSAIDAAVIDIVLPPSKIPEHLQELVRGSRIIISPHVVNDQTKDEESFRQILTLLRSKRGLDLSFYKQTTIRRRIIRRKVLNNSDTLKDYQDYIFDNKAEQDALFKDVLICVTAFFRDPHTFSCLTEKVFPKLFKDKTDTEPVRVWIAGCSTGEEAYSMAICLYEFFNSESPSRKIQVFATDISETVIAKARRAVYEKKNMAGVSEERMKRFFTKTDGSYQVNKVIREMCVFATQNFLKDPPFARMDLISCRNVLIYMEPYLQKKTFSTFHYALKPTGFLLLGKSETAGQGNELFQTFSNHEKIFVRKAFEGKFMQVSNDSSEAVMKRKDAQARMGEGRKDDYQKAGDEILLSKYTPVGVIVNEQLNIVQFRGTTGAYLEAPAGKATHNVLKMARDGLAFELRNALHKAKQNNEIIRTEGITLGPENRKVDIEIIPLQHTIEPYFMILFSNTVDHTISDRKRRKPKETESLQLNQELLRIEELEKELARLHNNIRAITEDQDAASEELQSANEDLLASSEELQSLNEELETSKEEIQSSNEELTILNQELYERNEQLVDARRYAEAIVSTIHEPLLILTRDFRVKTANKAFYERFQTSEQETEGHMFFELGKRQWDLSDIRERLNRVLPEQSYFEGLEINVVLPTGGERIMMLNARQLLNNPVNDEQLILMAIEDITERKQLERNQLLFSHELERQVGERTSELKEANIELQHSNENLQQFASIASHDLQEPLRKIKTFAAVLQKTYSVDLPGEGKDVIGKIRLSADRMSQLIREVLEYSKLTHGSREFISVDLDTILQNVLGDLNLLITETGALIDYPVPLPVVDAIPLQINQLFYNLLTNSIKFRTPATLPLIAITFRLLSEERRRELSQLRENISYLEIVVSDNGIGFEQQFGIQIFQLFERLHSTDEFEGTGVGLALCKKVVENHHGHIFAISKEGEGATFYVILPVNRF